MREIDWESAYRNTTEYVEDSLLEMQRKLLDGEMSAEDAAHQSGEILRIIRHQRDVIEDDE